MKIISNSFIFIMLTCFVSFKLIAADFYVCDCQAGADAQCMAGNDGNNGSQLTPWQTYEKARTSFANIAAGDAIHFCKGGFWNVNSANNLWINFNCQTNNRCIVTDYVASWASGDEINPILERLDGNHMFAFENGGLATHEEGYEVRNLQIQGNGTTGFGVFLYNDIDDVLLDNLTIKGFAGGVVLGASHLCSPNDMVCDAKNTHIVLSNSRITNNLGQGWLGASSNSAVLNNYFSDNGNRAVFDHNIYIGGASIPIGLDGNGNEILEQYQTQNIVVKGNQLYHSALDINGICQGSSMVTHGLHNNLLIEGNTVWEDIGFAGQGCWGIAVDAAYPDSEAFTNVMIRNNTVRNVGNTAIGVSSCQNCIIENNIIEHQNSISIRAIAAPDRTLDPMDAMNDQITIRNNSIYINNSGTAGTAIKIMDQGSNHVIASNAIYYAGNSTLFNCMDTNLLNTDFNAFDHNICYHPNASNIDWLNGSGNLSNWQNLSGFDLNSFAMNPGFADVNNSDFRALDITSLMIDNGDVIRSSQQDFLNISRDILPDIGAFEWLSSDLIYINGFE